MKKKPLKTPKTKPAKKKAVKKANPKKPAKKPVVKKVVETKVLLPVDFSRFENIFLDQEQFGGARKATAETVGKLYEYLRLGVPIDKACKWVGITKATYNRWQNLNPVFKATMLEARHFASKIARKAVIRQILQGDGKLALKFLAYTEQDEFTTRITVNREEEESPIWSKEEFKQLQEVFEDFDEVELIDDMEA